MADTVKTFKVGGAPDPETLGGKVRLFAHRMFHNAKVGGTVRAGEAFETDTVHADELKRLGIAGDAAPEADPAPEAAAPPTKK